LHVERAGRYYLLVGADDGIRLRVDGKTVLTRDEARPVRNDDDSVPLELTAGDHPIFMKLHQREGAWAVHVRLVDAELAPLPEERTFTLPGTTPNDTRTLASTLSSVSARSRRARRRLPSSPHGALFRGDPAGHSLPVHARLVPARAGGHGGGSAFRRAGGAPSHPRWENSSSLFPVLHPEDAKGEDQDLVLETTVGERNLSRPFCTPKFVREAIAHADRALAALEPQAPGSSSQPFVSPSFVAKTRHPRERDASARPPGGLRVAR